MIETLKTDIEKYFCKKLKKINKKIIKLKKKFYN